ncbi:MAG: BatD family protein [Aliarcobacter sp.]|nr:BatD family protein [Aliarcobacter sp.]
MKLDKFLLLIFLTLTSLFGNIKLSITSNTVIKNEPFIFVLEAFGNDIKFPNITNINTKTVQENSSSASTSIINNQISKIIKKSYSFNPTEDFILPSFEFLIDGEKYYTKEEKIIVTKASKTQSKLFDFTIKTNENDDLYVGENFILTLFFKYAKNSQIEKIYLEKPNFDNFWYKQLNDTKNYEQNDFIVTEVDFLMFPLKLGVLEIEPLKINAQIRTDNSYSIFSSTKNEKIYSNDLKFNIKQLPQDIKLIGDFQIEAFVDKENIKAGEALSYKLKIIGNGNIDEIKDIKLPINDVTIYENKPLIKSEVINNKYQGEYEKVFSIVADKTFQIPAVSLEYFDKDLNKIIKKETQSFNIEVISDVKKSPTLLEKAPIIEAHKTLEKEKFSESIKIVEKTSTIDRIVFFSFGMLTCLLIISLYFYVITSRRKKDEESKPLIKKIKNSKTKEDLIKILAIYIKFDSKLDELIFKLEKTNDLNTLKKEIVKSIKELKL